jgi:hypothetical protein
LLKQCACQEAIDLIGELSIGYDLDINCEAKEHKEEFPSNCGWLVNKLTDDLQNRRSLTHERGGFFWLKRNQEEE